VIIGCGCEVIKRLIAKHRSPCLAAFQNKGKSRSCDLPGKLVEKEPALRVPLLPFGDVKGKRPDCITTPLGLKPSMIAERVWRLDEGLVSRDRRAIREKIETKPKIQKLVSGSHQAKYLS
jgi:hypothetical protein